MTEHSKSNFRGNPPFQAAKQHWKNSFIIINNVLFNFFMCMDAVLEPVAVIFVS